MKVTKNNTRIHPGWWIAIAISFGLICCLPWWVTSTSWFGFDFNEKTGTIGDTIGGIMGPFIGIVSAILVFVSFREQRIANSLLTDELKYETNIRLIERLIEKMQKLAGETHFNGYSGLGAFHAWNLEIGRSLTQLQMSNNVEKVIVEHSNSMLGYFNIKNIKRIIETLNLAKFVLDELPPEVVFYYMPEIMDFFDDHFGEFTATSVAEVSSKRCVGEAVFLTFYDTLCEMEAELDRIYKKEEN